MQHPYPRFWRFLGAVVLSGALLTGLVPTAAAQWVAQDTNFPTPSTYVGDIEVVNNATVWITGEDGSLPVVPYNNFSRTTNGGTTWTAGAVTPAAGLGFSNISALSGNRAWAAMIVDTVGGGQLYKTTNGGAAWTRQLASGFPVASGGYLNAVRMYSLTNGIVMGDPLSTTSEFEVYTTTDGGTTWTPVPAASLPNPLLDEYGFQGLMVTEGTTNAWFGTNKGRVYRTINGGTTWTVATTGLTSVSRLAFSSATDGLVMEVNAAGGLVAMARTTNGGATWSTVTPSGTVYTSDLAAVPGATNTYVTAGARTGNSGSAVSDDGGLTWIDLEAGVERTAIGAADVTHVWAGAFTDATTGAGGIFLGDLTPAPPTLPTPQWVWARGTSGSNMDDVASGVSTDAAGNVYVTGRFAGIATFGTTTFTSIGDNDGFLAKYDPLGTVLWARQFGGIGADLGRDVYVDATGNVYVVGLFSETADFENESVASAGNTDAFLAKYSAAGAVQWVRAGGSTAADVAYQVATDAAGNVYAVGAFGGLNALTGSFDGTTVTSRGGADGFLVSYTAAGAVRWVRSGGGTGDEYAIGLGVTSAGSITIAGPFGAAGGGGAVTFGTTTLTSAGGTDGFVVSYNSTGSIQWARRFGGTADDGPNSIGVDAAGNAYVCGYLRGSVTFGGSTVAAIGSFNVLVLSYSAAGVERWVQWGGGDTGDSAYQLTVDGAGNPYITGFFQGPAAFGPVSFSTILAADVMVVKYIGATGAVAWGASVTGDDNEYGRGIAVDNSGNVYLVGSTLSNVLRFTTTITRPRSGGLDGYVAKIASPCSLTVPAVAATGPVCAGNTLTLTATGVPAGTTVRWTGPNGFTATTATATIPNATAAASGVYTLTVTSAAQGCSVTATVTATVTAPAAGPAATGPFGRCGPGTITLSVANTAGATYRWFTTATGGTPIAGATTATYTTPSLSATTTYYVSVTAPGGCESLRTTVAATVSAPPTVTLTAGGPTTFCAGNSLTLTAAGSAGATYQFLLNGQPVTGTTPTTLAVTQSGTYTVAATSGPSCATTSTALTVTVNPAANATFTYSATTFCLGGTAAIAPTISGVAGGTFNVLPASGLNVNPTTGAITLAGSVAGTYTVSYAVAAGGGNLCAGTSSQTVTLTAAPSATFTYAQPSYCTGAGLTATPALGTGAGAGAFSATPVGLVLNATTGVIDLSASAAGIYTITNSVAATVTCPAVLATTTVTVEATPAVPTVTPTPLGAMVLLTSSAATGNQWFLNGNLIAGATSATYTVTAAAQNGSYTVVVTAGACASAPSAGQTVTVTGLAADAAAAVGLMLFPNPTTDGRVTLTLAATAAPHTALTVLDATGRTVLTRTLPANTTRVELDARTLPAGVYAVRVGAAVRCLVRQ